MQERKKPMDRDIDRKASKMLIRLGCDPSKKGYTFIKEAVQILAENRDLPAMGLYREIADRHDSNAHRVERNIRTAVETIFERADTSDIVDFCGYALSASKGKQTNKEFIYTLYENIVQETT